MFFSNPIKSSYTSWIVLQKGDGNIDFFLVRPKNSLVQYVPIGKVFIHM
jgi:hypothetical protein